jgi:hypothetical protein
MKNKIFSLVCLPCYLLATLLIVLGGFLKGVSVTIGGTTTSLGFFSYLVAGSSNFFFFALLLIFLFLGTGLALFSTNKVLSIGGATASLAVLASFLYASISMVKEAQTTVQQSKVAASYEILPAFFLTMVALFLFFALVVAGLVVVLLKKETAPEAAAK